VLPALDDKLIADAVKLGKHKTKREAVNTALQEYIKLKRRMKILDLMGTVDVDPGYDYKSARRSGRLRARREVFEPMPCKGIAASLPDVLICAIAAGHNWPILTTDRDFVRYARYLPIRLRGIETTR
jgi:predicted nucleic acid-binding protein